ncbi:MAG: ATP-dependent RecD-like DNA helicase [Thermostichus sp. HHBFW_bins_43]
MNQQGWTTPTELEGILERITYHNPENGYTVARLQVRGQVDLVTVVGYFPQIQPGQTLKLWGSWKEHPQYGSQFSADRFQETQPATLTGIEKYLGSGLIKGVGPATAKRIVNHFGLETLQVIEQQIDRLREVPGVGSYRVQRIEQAWQEQKSIKEVMLFLQSHGVSTTHAVKIFKTYGDAAIATVQHNPYQLAQDIWGIGFKTADQIAQNLGIPADSDARLQAGLSYALLTATEEGHCFLPIEDLIAQAATLLGLTDQAGIPERLRENARQLVRQDHIKAEKLPNGLAACYHPPLYAAEVGLAELLKQRLHDPSPGSPLEVDLQRVQNWLERYTDHHGIRLSEEQHRAVLMAAQQPLFILTGGPGTGKTTTTRTITALWRAMGKTVLQASPTGRAAQRLAEVTGQEAKTIHRLLEFDPRLMRFKRDLDHPLAADALVIDEVSMIDLVLAYNLFKGIPPQAQVLLVGDPDQLPSVGPGQVLRDWLASGRIPTVHLTQVFRQAAQSQIVSNAHRINQGRLPQFGGDCQFVEASEPETVVHQIQTLITETLPARLGTLDWDPLEQLQVLCPMNRGWVGANHLNTVLQALLNPPQPHRTQLERGKRLYREGDRVIQLRNNYDLGIFNGDLGRIRSIDLEDQQMHIDFGERTISYDFADLNELALAYAITIHRAQGSEYPIVILPIHTQHFPMLSRNLLYTGLTRAKRLALLVGTSKAIAIAVRQVNAQRRYTHLAQRLHPIPADLLP